MAWNGFADNFTEGLESGTRLGASILKGRNARGVQEANAVLAEMQDLQPWQADPGGINTPEGDVSAEAVPGYDGETWDSYKRRYMEAMKRVSDPDVLSKMTEQLATTEKDKILSYGNAAVTAIQEGDMAKAQRYLAGVSFYTDPGTVPNISVTPRGDVVVDSGGKQMMMAPDDLTDMLLRVTDMEAYTDLVFQRGKHDDVMEHKERTLAFQQMDAAKRTNAYVANQDSAVAQRSAQMDEAAALQPGRLAQQEAELGLTEARTGYQSANTDSVKAKADRDRDVYRQGLEEKERATFDSSLTGGMEAFTSLMMDPTAMDPVNFVDLGQEDGLIGGMGGEDSMSVGQQVIADESELAAVTSQHQERLRVENAAKQAKFREELDANQGEGWAVAETLMGALLADDPDLKKSRLANLAFVATLADDSVDVFVDPESGAIKIGDMWYKLGGNQINFLAEKINKPQQGPAQPGEMTTIDAPPPPPGTIVPGGPGPASEGIPTP